MTPDATLSDTPSPPLLRPRGSNHVGMRQFNERVVLQAIRLNGSLPKADLARLTGLTAQTIGLITTRLVEDDLVVKQDQVRGRIGQPSVPMALNPDGAFSLGIKIGRRSADWLLVDFTGACARRPCTTTFPMPTPCCPPLASACTPCRKAWGRCATAWWAWAWPHRSTGWLAQDAGPVRGGVEPVEPY